MKFIDWTHISNEFTESNIKAIKRVEEVQNYKLSELMGTKLFSSYDLTQTEISLLLKGLNFSLPPQKLKFENHLLSFELLYRDVMNDEKKNNDDALRHLKSKIKDVGLSSFGLYNKKDHRFENLTEDEYEAFLNLRSNKNTIIQKPDKGNSVVVIDRLKYVRKMEELLSDRSRFVKIEFNSKHTVNQDIRHLLDMELEIKSCLDDLLNKNYLSKDDYKYLKSCGSKLGIMYELVKFIKVPQLIILYLLFDLFYQQLVLVTTTLQNFLYQYLNRLLLMNILSKIIFRFAKKFLTKTQICSWHLLIFIHCSLIYPWMKQLIFVLIWFSTKRKKLKACLSDISNNYLHFLLSHLVFFLVMFIINRLMV